MKWEVVMLCRGRWKVVKYGGEKREMESALCRMRACMHMWMEKVKWKDHHIKSNKID
jgi:hypothetical protein